MKHFNGAKSQRLSKEKVFHISNLGGGSVCQNYSFRLRFKLSRYN